MREQCGKIRKFDNALEPQTSLFCFVSSDPSFVFPISFISPFINFDNQRQSIDSPLLEIESAYAGKIEILHGEKSKIPFSCQLGDNVC